MVKAIWHSSPIKELIVKRINNVRNAPIGCTPSLWSEAYFWQTVYSLADDERKLAWEKLQDPKGKVKLAPDDVIRSFGPGEQMLKTSGVFSCKARVDAPVKAIDVELLVASLAKRFKVEVAEVEALLERCKTSHKARLTKRILENGKAV